MRRLFLIATLVASVHSFAQRKEVKETELKKESSAAPDKSLAGDLTRKKEDKGQAAPALQYDQFRLGVEVQVASKRAQQIEDLQKIISLVDESTPDGKKEMPKLRFRLGELFWEESKYLFFEANRKDDDLIRAMNAKDKAGQERAKAEKEDLIAKSKAYAKKATAEYSEIVQKFRNFERTDEVLYFLGHNLMEMGDERKALVAFRRLIEKFPKSKFIPDAHLAFGEYYFNTSKGKREMLEKALESYKKAADFPDNQVYGFALYKQGWCHFNLADYPQAMDKFKAVILYGELDKAGAEGNKKGLIKEARNDFVRSFGRGGGSPTEARAEFARIAKEPEDRFIMMKQLANLYYEDGKDKEAALSFNMLIKEKPLSPEAPGFQGKIVDCVLRAGNKKMTVDQVRRLVKVMDDVLKNNKTLDEKAKKALEEARELSERTISNLAVNWHNEAKKTRDDETFGFANEVYADYLTLFPENKKAYDLRFFWAELLNDNLSKYEKAAEEYTKVFAHDIKRFEQEQKGEKDEEGRPVKPGKWMVNAAYNSILAWDQVVKEAESSGKEKPPVVSDPNKKLEMAPKRKELLEACERYVKYVPNGEKKIEISFKAAKIYYDHNHLDEAVGRFADIALNHSDYKFENGDKAGEVAANLVLDSYNLLSDWAKVNEWARKFYASEKLATGKFREDLKKIIVESAFKLVNQLEAKQQYAKAAEAYLGFVAEFPKEELADQALFNAAIDFFNAKQLDRAIETRKRLIKGYPRSKFVPQTLYALCEGHEAIADFEAAADCYEDYAAAYEKSQGGKSAPKAKRGKKGKAAPEPKAGDQQVWEEAKAQVAVFNAGVFRDGLGQYKAALRNRERYLELWPTAKDAEAVFLSIVDLHEKYGVYGKALKQLEDYEKKYGVKDANKMLTSEGRMATIYEEKMKSAKNAQRLYDRIWSYYEKLPKRQKDKLEITALDPVARSHFLSNEAEFKKYTAIRLKWTKLTNVAEFKNSVKEKAKALEGIQKLYTATVGLKSADPAICALHKIGLAYDHFAHALLNPPVPKGMPEELLFEFKAQLDQQAAPVKDKAAEAFAAAVAKSQELDIFNVCTTKALDMLRDKYRPEQFPPMREDVLELKVDLKEQSIGGDLLTSIQPIPIVSTERAAALQQKAKTVAQDLGDLPPPPEKETEVAPVRTVAPAPKDEEPSDEPL
ncbi:MAG: tetratricopeptide repeat protein [Myxococcota bacterium]